MTIVLLILAVPFIIALIIVAFVTIKSDIEQKRIKKRDEELLKKWEAKPKTETFYNWVVDTENANKFVKAYREDLVENDDYYLSKKELLENSYEGTKVYKYEPLDLPLKLEGKDVYSYIDEDEWIKVGRLKKNAVIDGKLTLRLFVNQYKRVGYDSMEKDSGDAYFGVECIKTIENEKI